jgi:uncharacterized protein (DUF58 family)
MLLSPEFRSRLERFSLLSRGRVSALWAGRHNSVHKGESLDFADYREYVPGDDYRRIDHNLRARLGQLLIRQYEAEEELPLRIVIDVSASMGFHGKHATARRLAAMATYLALVGGDRAGLAALPGRNGRAVETGPAGRHPAVWPHLESWLEGLTVGGATPLAPAIRSLIGGSPVRGAVVLISDLLDPEWERALDGLAVGSGGLVLQVLGTPELEPELSGDLRLVDAETETEVEVSTGREALLEYRRTLEAFVQGVAGRARRAGLDYLLVPAGPDAEVEALRSLVAGGVVR